MLYMHNVFGYIWIVAGLSMQRVSTLCRHQMETFFALLAICAGNSPVTGEFPTQKPGTRSSDVFFDLRWINGWVNNREAGDLRCHRAHYDVIVMYKQHYQFQHPLMASVITGDSILYFGVWEYQCHINHFRCAAVSLRFVRKSLRLWSIKRPTKPGRLTFIQILTR